MIDRALVMAHRAEVLAAEVATYAEQIDELSAVVSGTNRLCETVKVLAWEMHVANGSPDRLPTACNSARRSLMLLSAAHFDAMQPGMADTARTCAESYAVPVANLPDQEVAVTCRLGGLRPDSCTDAEPQFVAAQVQLSSESGVGNHDWLSVYHDREGTPIALRKSNTVSSALLLEPVMADGQLIHAGTIVGVGLEGSALSGVHEHEEGWRLTSYHINDDDFVVRPARPSAWAYQEPIDRALFAVDRRNAFDGNDMVFFDQHRANMVASYSLQDFCSAAEQGLRLTGVRT